MKYKVGIVAHYIDVKDERLKAIAKRLDYLLTDPLNPPPQVVEEITSCQLILSSSLHGLIVADRFNIPNFLMPLSDKVVGGSYKFEDYYSVTGRPLVSKSAKVLGNIETINDAITEYVPIKNLRRIQRSLIASFPC